MMKNKNLWLKVAAVVVLAFPSANLFAQQAPAEPGAPALADLMTAGNYVELPALPEVKAPGAALEKSSADCPRPGRTFSPTVEDNARIKAVMKLLTDIYNGVHLPYSQDGAIFSNKEGRLPQQPRGYYKEYTLLTGSAPHVVTIGGQTYQVAPDLSARGSERVIIGGGQHIYYTPDHYAHFIELTVVY